MIPRAAPQTPGVPVMPHCIHSLLAAICWASLALGLGCCGGVAWGQLPADAGQVWKTYDIAPFVQQAGEGSQKHVVDWILQDTGYGNWHGDTVAALSANATTLRCFHTPEIQERVAETVARFVEDAAAPHRFAVRVLGIGSPAWRAEARPLLRPIPTSTPGVQAWMMSREEAAILVATLRRRGDCQELPTGPVQAANGLPATLSGGRKRAYVQDIALRPDIWPGWQTLGASCDEGMLIDVHPLISRDGTAVEAVLRCRIDQIERMASVPVNLADAQGKRLQIEVPQMVAVRVGERFRWPIGQVLVIGLGLVPWPVPRQNTDGSAAPLPATASRTDMVLVVEPRLSSVP